MISLLHAYMHVQKYTLKLHNERNLVLCCNAASVYNMLSSLIWHKRICLFVCYFHQNFTQIYVDFSYKTYNLTELSLKRNIVLALFSAKILRVYTISKGFDQRISKICTTIWVMRCWSKCNLFLTSLLKSITIQASFLQLRVEILVKSAWK